VKVRGDCSCCVIVDDIMNTSLAKIIKVDQADVSVVMLLAY
jgi:hypothetical protein